MPVVAGQGPFRLTNLTTYDQVWFQWNTTTSTSTTTVWPFLTTTVGTGNFTIQDHSWKQWVETEVERTARLDREQRAREERSAARLAAQQRMVGAQDRAMELLLSILTDEERTWHDLHDEIMVRGNDGGMYVIEKRSVHGNIRQVDEHGCLLGRICVAPGMYDREADGHLPLADGWVGQYLAIKHQEALVRATGNWSSIRTCQHSDVPVIQPARGFAIAA